MLLLVGVGATGCGGDEAPSPTTIAATTTTLPYAVTLVGEWALVDAAAGVAPDGSGVGLDGVVGSRLAVVDGALRFPEVVAQPDPERLVTVPDAPGFDVADGEYVVALRLRTTSPGEHNLVQHGQSDAGTFWKVELNANGDRPGIPHCTFVGTLGPVAVSADRRIDDGEWHDVACRHRPTALTIEVDGETWVEEVVSGPIANDRTLTVGGKPACDGVDVECDYYVGDLADLRIEVRRPR